MSTFNSPKVTRFTPDNAGQYSRVATRPASQQMRVWRDETLGWCTFYAAQQVIFNGKACEWASELAPD